MAAKKPVSATSFKKKSQTRAKKAVVSANKRAQHYAKGDKLMKQVSQTLNSIAKSHPNPKAKKQAKLALKKLGQAHTEFGSAGMCADANFTGNED
jgi:Skp family chaperone for outer membrane proteins